MMHTAYIVCGSPGAGKSTYAKKLAALHLAALLDIDTVTERLVRVALRKAGRDPDDRDAELSRLLGGRVEVHYVACPVEVRRQRLVKRGDARDQAKLRAWEQYIQYYGEECPPVFEHVLINGADLGVQ